MKITGGKAAKVTVRLRFASAHRATVNGATVPVRTGATGPYLEFAYDGSSAAIVWE